MTTKEARAKIRALEPFTEELVFEKTAVCKTGDTSYAVRNADDHDDIMTDYSAWIYGWRLKWVIDLLVREGSVTVA